MPVQRKRSAKRQYRRPAAKRPRAGGLVPVYRGFNPRRFSKGEWKYVDQQDTHVLTNAVTLQLLNGLLPGTSASQRIGMKVMIRSIEMRFWLNAAANSINTLARIALVLDKQANGAPGAAADVWDNKATPYNVVTIRNLANRKRFKIMWDKTLPVSTEAPVKHYHLYMKLRRPIITEYNAGVAGTIADIASNSIYLYSWSNDNTGANQVTYTFVVRVRYTDM